jgi:glutathione synthase
MIAAFWVDPLSSLNLAKDTSLLLMQEAKLRGYTVLAFETRDLYVNGALRVSGQVVDVTVEAENASISVLGALDVNFDEIKLCLIRKDPPVDENYIAVLQLLSIAEDRGRTIFVNPPSALLKANEKIYGLRLIQDFPEMVLSMNHDHLKKFRQSSEASVVLKPLNEAGSRGVSLLKPEDTDTSLPQNQFLIAQKFMPAVSQGDRRVFLIHGQIVGAISRTPPQGEFRCALSFGASLSIPTLSTSEINLCQRLGQYLKKDGLLFAGIDLIDSKLIEVNVTSPTLVRQFNAMSNRSLEKEIFDAIQA